MEGKAFPFSTESTVRIVLGDGDARGDAPRPLHHAAARTYVRFALENRRLFARTWVLAGFGQQIPAPGDIMPVTIAGMPIVLVRNRDGAINAFHNVCLHRGTTVVDKPCRNVLFMTCPYHAWTFDLQGTLVGVFQEKDFGAVDRATHGLVPLPVLERAGLIWVVLDRNSKLSIENFLCGYDQMLENFGFESWYFFSRRTLKGPNWKIAYDGYLDLYHLPILHKNTFGTEIPNRALYYPWGPHQRVGAIGRTGPTRVDAGGATAAVPGADVKPPEQWPDAALMSGVWTIFPHISIASFDAGGRGVMLSQLFPGESALESYTVQNYLMEKPPSEEQREAAHKMFEMLEFVVREEDYATGLRQQRALQSGARSHVLFGRNEGGGQRFHGYTDRLIAMSDDELCREFGG